MGNPPRLISTHITIVFSELFRPYTRIEIHPFALTRARRSTFFASDLTTPPGFSATAITTSPVLTVSLVNSFACLHTVSIPQWLPYLANPP